MSDISRVEQLEASLSEVIGLFIRYRDEAIEAVAEVERERDEARHVARSLWLCWSYREKEERDRGLMEWIKEHCPWIMED